MMASIISLVPVPMDTPAKTAGWVRVPHTTLSVLYHGLLYNNIYQVVVSNVLHFLNVLANAYTMIGWSFKRQ